MCIRTPIPGTIWVVVRTSDNKKFFFNTETKKSHWKKPAELESVDIPEPALAEGASRKHAADTEPRAGKRARFTDINASDDDDDDDDHGANEQQSVVLEGIETAPPQPEHDNTESEGLPQEAWEFAFEERSAIVRQL